MSRHRALRAKVKRGIAKWPVLIVVFVVLIGLGWLVLSWAGGVLDRRSQALAQNCSEGDSVLRVAATPSVAESVAEVARAYSKTRPVVYDHCIAIEVTSADSSAVLEGLTTSWDENKLGKRPHAWLPDSTLWANRLSALNAKLVGAAPKSVGTSPVLLAAPEAAAPVLKDFRWTDMPEVTDWSKCDADPVLRYFSSPRQVAGGPLAEDVLKCQLKPLNRSDHAVTFTDEQWSRLSKVVADGVCDWSRPGLGQGPAETWLGYGTATRVRYGGANLRPAPALSGEGWFSGPFRELWTT